MMHPLLALIATRPGLLTAHAEAYAALAAAELGQASAGWQRRLIWAAAALCCLMVAMALAGVALRLWAMLPAAAANAAWALIAVPLAPLALALACLAAARRAGPGRAFGKLRQQLQADLRMLREVGGP